MLTLFCRNKVLDFQKWHAVFKSHHALHQEAGLTLQKLWQEDGDQNHVFFVFSVEDKEKALGFIHAPVSAEAGKIAGVIEGEFYFLNDFRA